MRNLARTLSLSIAALLVLGMTAAPVTTAAAVPDSPVAPVTALAGGELRAYWVDAFGPGIYDGAQIDALVASVKAANLNTIIAQVVRRGDCFCNRASVPRTEQAGVAAFPFDPLQTLIEKAHAQGVQVHAWVISTAIWRAGSAPAAAEHVFNHHGPSANGSENWIQTRSDGMQFSGDWMIDPGHPDAAEWMVRTATSIVANYDVDGINLDRIRYPDGNLGSLVPSWGYNPVSLARFQQAAGRTDRPANTDPQWVQWRRDQITGVVRKIYLESYALKPNVRVSVDTITYGNGPQRTGGWEGSRAYAEQLQDWIGWLREGIVDLNITMNYKRDALNTGSNNQRLMYQEWSDFTKDWQFGRQSVVGAALYLNGIAESGRQVRTALEPSSAGKPSAGWVGYSYRTPDDLTDVGAHTGAVGREQLTRILTTTPLDGGAPVFAAPAAVPPMPWKAQPTAGHVRGIARGDDGVALSQVRVTLADAVTGGVVRTQLTDGFGWYGFTDVPPGAYRVTVASPRLASGSLGSVSVTAGGLASPSLAAPAPAPAPQPSPLACAGSSIGPGIPPPPSVPAGQSGFHAAWYGQSGYPTLCTGERSTATIAYYNSGSRGWTAGRMGEMAYLGTWSPDPGQDRVSALGGDGTLGSPNTSWPRYNRIAAQPAPWVGPGQVSWFQFTIQAPPVPGTYRLHLRPLIEGAQWLEDYGVHWVVTVR